MTAASSLFECCTCCFGFCPSRDCISRQNLKFDGQVEGKPGKLHWRQAFVSWHPKSMMLWLIVITVPIFGLAVKQYLDANEPYPGQYASAEFATVGLVTMLAWAMCKFAVQVMYGPRTWSDEEEYRWSHAHEPPPRIAQAQWFFHTLAVPLNWVALFMYVVHIGFGYRKVDITFVRSLIQMVVMTMNLFIGREPFLEMHFLYVFLVCLVYGVAMFAAFGNTYPVQDTFIGLALSIPIYGVVYVLENITQLVYKGDVFYVDATDPARTNAVVDPITDDEEEQDEDVAVKPKRPRV